MIAVVTQVAVPNLVGQTQAAATTAITGLGLVLGAVTTANSSTVAAGNVISSSPAAGTMVNQGSVVSLVVSSGPIVITLKGDLNGDGVVNNADLGIALLQAIKAAPCTNADITGPVAGSGPDGACDILDIVMIAKQIVGG